MAEESEEGVGVAFGCASTVGCMMMVMLLDQGIHPELTT